MLCLPVDNRERAAWDLTAPASIGNTHGDSITYHVAKCPEEFVKRRFPASNYSSEEAARERFATEPNFPGAACFSSISPHYDQFEIRCYPRMRTLKDFGLITEFFQILVAHEIVISNLELKDGNPGVSLLIPQHAGNPHLIYTALTAFRWADCHGALVWEFVQRYQRGLSPFQILPYLIAKYVNNCNHSFINSYPKKNLYGRASSNTHPLVGVAARMYFQGLDPETKKAFEDPRAHINTAIDELAGRLMPTETKKVNPKSSWDTTTEVEVPAFQFEKPEDALSPELKVFYEDLNLNRDRVVEILQSLFTKELKKCDESAS